MCDLRPPIFLLAIPGIPLTMDMGDMDPSHNWLAFSLSTHHQPFLFDPFPHHGGEAAHCGSEADLAMVTDAEPKLEDFLGRGEAAADQNGGGIYDSDLKTIAAGFLRCTPSDQPDIAVGAPTPPSEPRKAVDTFGQRTSIYRGVTRHRWTGRYEAHLWDNSCRREGQSRKGRQVYLGGYDKEEKAARAYDLAALKYWGPSTTTNFPVSNYEKEVEEMKSMTRQEFVASLRRKSSGFSRGASIYRGVTRHHQHGRWQARIGRVAGNKDLYLGTFSTQEEAAEAYDIAAIKFRGLNAVTNFDMSRYDVKSIANSNLPIGGMSGRTSKASETSSSSSSETISVEAKQSFNGRDYSTSSLGFANLPSKQDQDYWTLLALQQQQQQRNQTSEFGVYSSGVNMDFSAASGQEDCGLSLVWSNGILQPQQTICNNLSAIPYATPIPIGFTANYEGSANIGNWVAPSPSTYYNQSAKPSVAAFQTPIYGIE